MTATSNGPAYRIETARLMLRCWSPEDARAFRALLDRNDAHLRPWIPWMRDEPMSLAATVQRLRRDRARFDLDQDFRYAAHDRDGALIGLTGLHPRVGANALEIGYLLDRDAAGRGLALEMAAAMVRVAFEVHGVARLEVHCDPANAASAAVPRKLGFTHEVTRRRCSENSEGRVTDSMIWTLFVDEYRYSPASTFKVTAWDCLGMSLPLAAARAADQRSSVPSE